MNKKQLKELIAKTEQEYVEKTIVLPRGDALKCWHEIYKIINNPQSYKI